MAAGSIVNAVGLRIRELLQAYPRIPATVIAERTGWDRGLTVLFAMGRLIPLGNRSVVVRARFRGLAGGAGRG